MITEPRRLPITLPRPPWIFLATVVLIVGAIAAKVGLLIHRHGEQKSAIREIQFLRGEYSLGRTGPEWLRSLVGEQWMMTLDDVEEVKFPTEMAIFDRGTTGAYGVFSKLSTTRAAVDDVSVACLTKLPSLKRLNLRYTNVGDGALEHICRLSSLEELDLVGAEVSDVSVGRLKQLRKLKMLNLGLTMMTSDGATELQTALPSCTVKFYRRFTYAEYLRILNPKLEESTSKPK